MCSHKPMHTQNPLNNTLQERICSKFNDLQSTKGFWFVQTATKAFSVTSLKHVEIDTQK